MKKMWKRFVSLLLACTLLAGMLPLSASAAVSAPTDNNWVSAKVNALNGELGDEEHLYKLDGWAPIPGSDLFVGFYTRSYFTTEEGKVSTTVMFIAPGNGGSDFTMPDYSGVGELWADSGSVALHIADGVTGIGSHAFNGMDTLEKVVFQDASKLTYVGSYAFSGDNKAQFTDEGNSGAAGDDPTRILDLSHVKKMGENAFYNCDGIKGVELSGNITAVETDEDGGTQDIKNKIPNHAFESCNALTSITVPEGITTIGTAAFAGCTQASSITLPDSLVTIEDRAFMCSIDGANRSLTSLTIPENVETIGASAFYGYKALATVTVESTVLEEPGDAAFGKDAMSAYSGPQTVGDVTVQNGGTTFKTPNANITKLFVNYDNCYLGPISPLTLIEEKSWPATCQHVGRNTYAYKYYEEEQELFEEIEMLPHVYITPSDPTWPEGFPEEKYPVDFPETCDTAPYRLSYCFNCLTEAYPAGDITAVTEPHTTTEYGNREEEPGHDYNCAGIGNETIQEGKNTTISYSCDHAYHDDVRDGIAQEYGVTFKGFTLTANTVSYQDGKAVQNTLKSIAMPRNVYTESGTLVGAINWASSVNLEEKLSEDTKQYPVVFTPSDALKGTYDGMEDVDSYEDKILQVTVTVSKTVLSLENLRFENVLNFMDVNSSKGIEATVAYQSQDLTSAVLGTEPKSKSYTGKYADGQNESTTDTAPVNSGAWDGTVTMTFTYNSDLYQVDTETANEEYTVVDSKNGTLQVTHTYKISKEDLSGASVIAISRPYLETEESEALNAFRLIDTPAGSTVNWTWRNVSDFSETDNGTFITEDTSTNFAPIKEAGTYEIEVIISNPNCTPEKLTLTYDKNQQVTISPARVQIPLVSELTEYTGREQTALNKPADTAGWQYTEESVLAGKEAGTYTATAKLKDTRNYAWYDGNDPAQNAENGEYTITWSIAKRDIFEPLYQGSSGIYTLPYSGQVQKNALVDKPTKVSNLFEVEEKNKPDGTTSWIGTFIATNTQVFEITNIGAQNASKYTIQAVISEEAFQNFQWENHKDQASFDLANWEITKYQVKLNQVTAPGATYTAEAYTGNPNVVLPTGLPDNGLEVTSYTYYTHSGGRYNEIEKNAVIDAGTYYVRANYAFQGDTENSILKNYNLVQPRQYASFTITPYILTLNGTTRTEQYTGGKFTVTDPTVTLLEGDQGEAGLYTYTYTTYPEDDEQHQNPITHTQSPEYEDVGTYLVYVGIDSKNYSADPVECKLEIRSSNQTVKLTQEGGTEVADGGSISKTLGDDPFTVTGKGYVGENETNAKIAYAVTQSNASDQSEEAVVKVDANSGRVTLLRAGSATITVTAEGSANYQAATATYTITVDKGTPTVAVQMPEGGSEDHTYSYTGEELRFAATVTGAPDAVEPVKEEKVSFKFYQDNSGSKDAEISGGQPTGIGTYWVEAVYAGDDNYNPKTSEPVQFTISPAALEVEATGYTDTYNGGEHDPVASITVTGVDGNTFAKGDYTVSYIEKGSDGEAKPDVDNPNWNPGLKVKDVAHSGDYWIKVVINDNDSYDPYIGSVKVTINPKPLTVTKTVKPTKEYDGTTDAKQNVKFTHIDTDIEGETVTAMVTQAEYNSPNVSDAEYITITYHLTAVEDTTKLENYTLEEGGDPISGDSTTEIEDGDDVAITPKPIDVAITNKEKVYDGKAAAVTSEKGTDWTVNETDLCELKPGIKDNLGIALSIASGSKDAGTYAITGKWTNKNYEVTFTGSWTGGTAGTYTITPRPIKVEIGDAEGFYGDAPVKPSGLLKDISTEDGEGLVEGDSLDQFLYHVVINASPNTDVGSHYTITGTSGEYGNYNVTFASGTYTVKPRPITITIKDHRSKYGAAIDDGIATPVFDTDYTVAITNQATTGDAIVKGDNLEIKLTTKATADSPVDDYDITGSAEGEKVNNYAITWAGNGGDRDGGGKNGKYTIDKAGLKVEFDHHDKVLNGVSINITDSYNANPLVLKNASTDAEVSKADKETLDITYSIGAAGGGAGGVSQIAEINETTGEVTIHSTGTVRVTATVTPQGSSNYTGTQTTWYELNIISGGQMALTVTPKTNLAYTGDPQALLESASCSLDSAEIQYSLDNQDWGDEIPEGTNAGTYTVYVKATDPSGQYSDVTEHVTVTIDKADLKGRFARDPYPHVLATGGNRYDSAQANPLTITSQNYNAEPANYTYYSDNMQVASSANGTSTIVITGTAGESATIRVTVPGDNNYNEGTFTYTLEISDDLSKIEYSVGNQEVTYNGQPQTIAVKVSEPDSGATVMYWNEKASAYDLSEPPAYTDVQAGGYPIKFQITAPGYEAVTDEATLKIEPKDISQCKVEGIAESYTYVGHQIVPETVAVVDGSVILTKDTDYTLEYGANQEVGEGEGSVIIKGTGNYTGKVIEYFDIIPVDGSSGITASIAPNFGTYDPDAPVTAEVTVTHQTGSDSHDVDLTAANAKYTISATDLVTGQAITDHGATGTGGTLTFTKPAIYDITLTLTGDHQGEFRLSYTLLPLSNDDGGLTLTVDDETQKVFTYGGEIDPSDATIKVTANNTDVTDQCTLTYVYTPFEGTPTTTASPYTAEVLKNAGVYTVTATPKDGSAITGTGTFTFLILQRDLAEADLTVEDSGLVYNQNAQEPAVTVEVTGNPTANDYEVTYYNNVNASDDGAKAVVTAKGNNFTGSKTVEFTIAPKPITGCVVGEILDQHYTGEPVTPPVTITDGNYTLILGYDYTTACADKGPGEATVTITGTGNYTGEVEKTFTIKSEGAPEPSERFDLVVTPSQWTWGDDLTNLDLSVTFGTDKELTLGTEYTLEVNGQTFDGTTGKTKDDALTYIKGLKPDEYTITATGMDAYAGSTDTETVTIQKIQPTVTVKATPNSLSGGGKVTLTLKGEKLPNGTDLKTRLSVTAKNDNDVTLEDLHIQWPEDGSLTAELTLPNTSETYTFTLTFTGNEYYEAATASEQVVVAQQIISGGGGGPVEDQPANPDDTGVSDWLNTKDHLAYLAGYPGGTFGPDQNMTRAEAAQMFYNLLLEKDVEITVEFEDVPADAWYAKPVNTLASLGILSGVGDGQFDPDRSITRAEFTVIAMKFANTSGGGVNIFSDVNEDDWFYSAVVDSTQYGWINGYPDGTFRPEATISRAEVTVIVNHMLGRAADRPYVIAHEEELNTFGDVNRGHWGYFHVAEATNAHEYHTEDGTESWTGLS